MNDFYLRLACLAATCVVTLCVVMAGGSGELVALVGLGGLGLAAATRRR